MRKRKMSEHRFKFRAWSIKEQKYYYDVEDAYSDDCKNSSEIPNYLTGDEHYNFGGILEDPNYIIEQCTGVKDKNGKLIYEGDVICLVEDGEIISIGVVKWSDDIGEISGGWIAIDPSLNGTRLDKAFIFTKYWEIYGNVHEKEIDK